MMPDDIWMEGIGSMSEQPRSIQPGGLKLFSAKELQNKVFAPIQWIAPGLIPEGLTLLCGKPKLGKSWAALDLAFAVAEGGQFLGTACDQGDVLYLALEDNQRRLQDRLRKIQPNAAWPSRLQFAVEAQRLNEGGLQSMEDWIATSSNPRLLIADTLATIRPTNGGKDDYKADYGALRGLHKLASEHRIGVLVVHHVRKADADDVYDTVSGSTGLTGAADATLILGSRVGESGTEVTLYGKGRDIKGFQHAVEFVQEHCRWNYLGDPDQVFVGDTRRSIIAALEDGCQSPSQVQKHTGLSEANTVQTLKRMVEKGQIRKTARGRYDLIEYDTEITGDLSEPSGCQDEART
jgi:hypothetical protein